MRNRILPLLFLSLSATTPAWAIPESVLTTPAGGAQNDEDRSKQDYNDGLALAEKGDQSISTADAASDDAARGLALESAHAHYEAARQKFQDAAKLNPGLPGAWNMIGYTERRLGNHDAALAAYERALALNPNYAQAIEYRAEAYLGLNRIEDAKQAYLDLFASNRALSDQLLAAMQKWVSTHRKSPGNVAGATVKELDRWVQERGKIAAKTASLTRAGAAASWQ